MKTLISLILMTSMTQTFASANKSMNDAKSITKESRTQTTETRFSLGLGYASHSFFRGALLDGAGGAAPTGYLTYGNFTFAGLALVYNQVVFDNQVLSLGTNYFTDHGFKKIENSNFRQLREATFDSWIQWMFPLWTQSTMSLSFHQDLKANKSQYYTVGIAQAFLTNYRATVESGFGTLRTNEYTFGRGAKKGLSNIDFGLSWSKNVLPWDGSLTLEYKHSLIPHGKNRTASFVRHDDERGTFTLNTIWTL